jgi:hypothetical protein
VSAESIACLADKGKDVSRFFSNSGRMMGPIQRVNVDFASPMLDELDKRGKRTEYQPPGSNQNADPTGT